MICQRSCRTPNRAIPALSLTFSLVLALAVAGTVATGAPAKTNSRWIHIKVDQTSPEKETVRVNLPVQFVASLMPALAKSIKEHARFDSLSVHDVDLRKVCEAVRDAEDGEYVTVDSKDETVRIAKKDGIIRIHVRDTGEDAENVEIKIKMEVLDALVSGPPGELNIEAAVDVLGEEEAELVTVNDGDETVRIWVDSKASVD
jgi:hypothetical protein